MIKGLNHITLAVSDIEKSLRFYTDILGFKGVVKWNTGAYLSAGELWLCLSKDAPKPGKDYTHIAFDIEPDNFSDLVEQVKNYGLRQWKKNSSEGDSLYLLDPDGHKLEVHCGSLQTRLTSLQASPYEGLIWL